MNVLCLGARVIGPALAQEVVRAFLAARSFRAPSGTCAGSARSKRSRRTPASGVFDRGQEEACMSDRTRSRDCASSARASGTTTSAATCSRAAELDEADPRGRARGHDLEPDDLPEGDRRDRALRRGHPPRRGRRQDDRRDLRGPGGRRRARAADVFRPVFDAEQGNDGFVSIEVGPHLARDTQGSIPEARRLWKECGRPNVMVKIPATAAGIPAIRQCLSEGININITLLFSVPALPRGHGGLPLGARGAGRGGQARRRPCARSRASSSAAWTPTWTRSSTRSRRRRSSPRT